MAVAKVVVRDATVAKRQVGNREFRNQFGFLDTGTGETLRIEIPLPDSVKDGYPVGEYAIAGESFDKDQYGRPCFGRRGLFLEKVK
jgi:hypothetical protein